MKRRYTLEISVENIEGALAAERGGAQRIELCANLSFGGTTPDTSLIRKVRASLPLPIFAMIRPRPGNFVYSESEIAAMRGEIESVKKLGIDGVVLGILSETNEIDVSRTRDLVEFARPLPVTFHRAFDEVVDQRKALADVIATGAARILTSGGAPTAPQALGKIAELVRLTEQRIIILPGRGITPSNILEVAKQTGSREFHAGLSSITQPSNPDYAKFEAAVRTMANQMASFFSR